MIADCGPKPSGGLSLVDELDTAIRVTRWAQVIWAFSPIRLRLSVLRRLRASLSSQAFAVAQLSADLRHRPVQEVITSELVPLLEACRFLERHAASVLAPRRVGVWGRPLWLGGVRSKVYREPLGVVLIHRTCELPSAAAGYPNDSGVGGWKRGVDQTGSVRVCSHREVGCSVDRCGARS